MLLSLRDETMLLLQLGLMAEATRCLELSEAGTRQQMRTPKPRDLTHHGRFPYGLEWEILNADAVILLGLTHTLRLDRFTFRSLSIYVF